MHAAHDCMFAWAHLAWLPILVHSLCLAHACRPRLHVRVAWLLVLLQSLRFAHARHPRLHVRLAWLHFVCAVLSSCTPLKAARSLASVACIFALVVLT